MDGQKQYYKDLDAAIRQDIKDHPSEFREEGEEDEPLETTAAATEKAASEKGTDSDAKDKKPEDAAPAGPTGVLDQAKDMVGNAVGMVMDTVQEASLTTLALGGIVLLLLISNIWTLSSSSSRGRDPNNLHRLRGAGKNDDPEAVGRAVRDALRDLLQPSNKDGQRVKFGSPQEELQQMSVTMDNLEQRIQMIRKEIADAARVQKQ